MSLLDTEPAVNRGRVWWWVAGAVLSLAVVFVMYSFIGTFVFGLFLYYATRPVYRWVRPRVDSPSVAAGIAIFALALPALALISYAGIVVVTELRRLDLAVGAIDLTAYPGIDSRLVQQLSDPTAITTIDFGRYLTVSTLSSVLRSLGDAAGVIALVGTMLIHLFVILAIGFYLLRDDHRIARWSRSQFADENGILETYIDSVDNDLDSVFFGNILNAVLTGTIGVVVYAGLNAFAPSGAAIPAAALVGLLAGVASLIPVVGMKLVYVPVAMAMALRAVATGATETLWFVGLFAVVSFIVVDTVPDLVLRPYVSGRSLHVGAVMLAYTLGPLLFGWYGIFLMPMLLVLVVQFARIVLPELLSGTEIRPYAVDPTYHTEAGTDAGGTAGVPVTERDGTAQTGSTTDNDDPTEN